MLDKIKKKLTKREFECIYILFMTHNVYPFLNEKI